MKITSKGQVTIPKQIRQSLGFLPNTEVEFIVEKDGLRLVKPRKSTLRGKELIEHMRGRGTSGMTTAQIMALMRGEP